MYGNKLRVIINLWQDRRYIFFGLLAFCFQRKMYFDVREHMALNKSSSQGWIIASKCARHETVSVNSRTKRLPNTASFKAEETLAFQATRSAASGLCGNWEPTKLSFQRRQGKLPLHTQNVIIERPGHPSPQVHSRSKHRSSSLPLKDKQKRPLGINN